MRKGERLPAPSRARRRTGLLGFCLAAALVALLPACKEHPLSGQDLNALKAGTLEEKQGKITAEEEFRILGIQARTRSDYDRQVNAILTRPTQPAAAGGTQKKAATGG